MNLSEDMKQASKLADEAAEKHDARARKRDREIYASVDGRVAELDRAVANAEVVASEGQATVREQIKHASDQTPRVKGKRPPARPGA
ncbi:MAG: hypothetical protein ACXVHB_18130 [Solirubrobacteraceae bacterium]